MYIPIIYFITMLSMFIISSYYYVGLVVSTWHVLMSRPIRRGWKHQVDIESLPLDPPKKRFEKCR